MKSIQKILWLPLVFTAACHPESNSHVDAAWDTSNNPVVMMAYTKEFETHYNQLPTKGQPSKIPWTDTYWASYHGGIAYRWNSPEAAKLESAEGRSRDREFAGQREDDVELQKVRSTVLGYALYSQAELASLNDADRDRVISSLSPAEKFDIYRGAYDYPTVVSERKRTKLFSTLRDREEFKKEAKIPTWYGICHAWAPATILFQEPGPIELTSKDGFKIPMGASDTKALLSHMLDREPGQARVDTFLAARCNNDLSEGATNGILDLVRDLKLGDRKIIDEQVKKLEEIETMDGQTRLVIGSYIAAFAPDHATAMAAFQKLYEYLKKSNSNEARALSASYAEAQKYLVNAGTPAVADFDTIEKAIRKAINKPACSDTNPGAFHLVLANLVGMQERSFGIDVTRDAQVWNQAVASYESKKIGEFTGKKMSEGVAPGTVKEIQVRTILLYTTEKSPANHRYGDDVHLQSYDVQLGDTYKNNDGSQYKALEYRLELDREGRIIGGSWISETRPDFLWGTGDPIFSKNFSDLEDIYYQSID